MNPEDLLLSALAACTMLWCLHYAAVEGIVVTGYEDNLVGMTDEHEGAAGRFARAILRPKITVRAGCDIAAAHAIQDRVHEICSEERRVGKSVSVRVDHGGRRII